MKLTKWIGMVLLLLSLVIAGCSSTTGSNELTKVTFILDWVPNTNHTGLYVALENGYYEQEGLDVEIISPGEGMSANTSVAAGNAQFGINHQEGVTQARAQGIPVVSIAAIIQNNTSVFASPKHKNITSPRDFEGKVYGGWGDPIAEAVIESIMVQEGADFSKVDILNTGFSDFFTAVERDIDFAWIFYGWDGIHAELLDFPLNLIHVSEQAEELNYYSPVIITNDQMIEEQPDVVKAFMAATAKGYQHAIDNAEDAARILLNQVPDLNEDLVIASQLWLSEQYQADATRWGEQEISRWENYYNWMKSHELLDGEVDVHQAFTNEFIPKQ